MRSTLCRRLPVIVGTVLTMFLAACDTLPRPGEASSAEGKLPISEKIAESLAAADKAQKLGKTSNALEELEDAIRVEPSSKLPWLRKAQIHFDARQYGQAITAAQEVLQRDADNTTAKSILAVSGLRVSAQALEQLRKANEINGSARTEAEGVARLIREALGEPILVGGAAKVPDAPRPVAARPAPRSVVRAVARPAAAPAANSPPASGRAPTVAAGNTSVSSPVNASPSPRGNNPFGALQ